MCIRIRFAVPGSVPIFDPATQTIALPLGLDRARAYVAARAVLAELAVPQGPFGAVCYCGEQLDLTPRIPYQRTKVMAHGA
ncbi:hypothetical protein PUR34_41600 [Streptomyces sp. JV185]|uniref:hypothetical protein n=1 Tax=Streptomyces sp. JV185 TaxID=858638 RepID=UPI002E772BF1|nr:hypothetical protein [Streptomyces sp. JV185]MEE1774501.1 hypothetical protein [Streptomyces sp. JV185]